MLRSFIDLYLHGRGSEQVRVLTLGLKGAGKTTLHGKLGLGHTVTIDSEAGFNVETLPYKTFTFVAWDAGEPNEIQSLRQQYYPDTKGIIFVVDSTDRSKTDEACQELHRTLEEDELKDALLLVFANKQDLPHAMNTAEITDHLKLKSIRHRTWYIQSVCVTSGDGLYEGFEWLFTNLKRRGE